MSAFQFMYITSVHCRVLGLGFMQIVYQNQLKAIPLPLARKNMYTER